MVGRQLLKSAYKIANSRTQQDVKTARLHPALCHNIPFEDVESPIIDSTFTVASVFLNARMLAY